jgi:hypothetical protein
LPKRADRALAEPRENLVVDLVRTVTMSSACPYIWARTVSIALLGAVGLM